LSCAFDFLILIFGFERLKGAIMARSLNRAQLIGRLTRDPELRYTPNGAAVCGFGIATNRTWTTDTGEKREEVEFHNIVAWRKLAEICSQYLSKGKRVYIEGRLTTRSWTGQDGQQKSKTEIIMDDMIMLDSKGFAAGASAANPSTGSGRDSSAGEKEQKPVKATAKHKKEEESVKEAVKEEEGNKNEEVSPDDIPF